MVVKTGKALLWRWNVFPRVLNTTIVTFFFLVLCVNEYSNTCMWTEPFIFAKNNCV